MEARSQQPDGYQRGPSRQSNPPEMTYRTGRMWFSGTSSPSTEHCSKIQSRRVHVRDSDHYTINHSGTATDMSQRATLVTESFPCDGAMTEPDWILELNSTPDGWCQQTARLANHDLQDQSANHTRHRSGGLRDAETYQKRQFMPQEDVIRNLEVASTRSWDSSPSTARQPWACEDNVVDSFSMDHNMPLLARYPAESISDKTPSTVDRKSSSFSSTLDIPQPGYFDLTSNADSVLHDWWPHYSFFHETEPSLCKLFDPAAKLSPEMWPYAASCFEESVWSDQSNAGQAFFVHPGSLVEQHEDTLQDDSNSADSVASPELNQEGRSCNATSEYAKEGITELWQPEEFPYHRGDRLTESVRRLRNPLLPGSWQPPEVTRIRPTPFGYPTPTMTEDFPSSRKQHVPPNIAQMNGPASETPLHLMSICPKRILPRPKEVSGSILPCSTQSQKNSDSRIHRRSTTMESPQRQDFRDAFLVQSKLAGMSYKQIKEKGQFSEAESTLRGRFRTLTKHKEHRVRKPEWHEADVSTASHLDSKLLQLDQPSIRFVFLTKLYTLSRTT